MCLSLLPLNLTRWKSSFLKTSIISAGSVTKREWTVRSPLYFSKFQATCSANKGKTSRVTTCLPQALPQKHEKPSKAKLEKLPSSNYSAVTPTTGHHWVYSCYWEMDCSCPPFSEILTFLILNFHSSPCKSNVPHIEPTGEQASSWTSKNQA